MGMARVWVQVAKADAASGVYHSQSAQGHQSSLVLLCESPGLKSSSVELPRP
jgi:hypothetical protein